MGDESPGEGEVQKVTIQIAGPLSTAQFEAFKDAMRKCLEAFKGAPYRARVTSITIEKKP
jgi:hypothetical protein